MGVQGKACRSAGKDLISLSESHSHLSDRKEGTKKTTSLIRTRRQISTVCLDLACLDMLIKDSSTSWPGVMPLFRQTF